MRIELSPKPSGSLVPSMGRVQPQWLPLLSLLFLLILLMALVNQLAPPLPPIVSDHKTSEPATTRPTPKPRH